MSFSPETMMNLYFRFLMMAEKLMHILLSLDLSQMKSFCLHLHTLLLRRAKQYFCRKISIMELILFLITAILYALIRRESFRTRQQNKDFSGIRCICALILQRTGSLFTKISELSPPFLLSNVR